MDLQDSIFNQIKIKMVIQTIMLSAKRVSGRQVPIFAYFSQHTPIFPIFF